MSSTGWDRKDIICFTVDGRMDREMDGFDFFSAKTNQ
jgi:hypothetical protein